MAGSAHEIVEKNTGLLVVFIMVATVSYTHLTLPTILRV